MKECIYILLPVHNRREITRQFIDSLKTQTYTNYHLLLIDDGSTDGTEQMVREQISNLTVITGKGNWWWAGSLQQGYNWLKKENIPSDDIVLIINDDTNFQPNFLETAVSLLKKQRRTLLLAQYFSHQNKHFVGGGMHVDWKNFQHTPTNYNNQINCLSTRGLFLRIIDFYEIGGFFPKLLPHYASDFEFTIRARRKGMKLITDSTLKLWGNEETTGVRQIGSDPPWVVVKNLFSKKATINPFMLSAYVALACPIRWKINSWFWIWAKTFKLLLISIVRYVRKN